MAQVQRGSVGSLLVIGAMRFGMVGSFRVLGIGGGDLRIGSFSPKQYMAVYRLAMLIPRAIKKRAFVDPFPVAPGARCTVVYEKPVTIRELANELDVTMSFLHRKVRAGKLPGFRVGDQVCVTPAVAALVREWYTENRGKWWPRDGFADPDASDDETEHG